MENFFTMPGIVRRSLSLFILTLLMISAVSSQEVIKADDGSSYIRFELEEYSYFSRMVIVNEFLQLQDAKVAISDETGVIYIYPLESDFNTLQSKVRQIIGETLMMEKNSDKEQQTTEILKLKSVYGNLLENYALSGKRSTENDSCHTSLPFCTNSIYTFPAGTNTQSQSGPNYNCLSTQPNPAWYHLRILDPGPITIFMSSSPLRDIDFCLWGPYEDPILPCPMTNTPGGLTSSKVVSCSYSPNPTENALIPNGQPGQYYILIITNYSNQPCDITFQKTGGTGTTDCTILPPPAASNSPVCVGNTLQLTAASVGGAQYHWTGPGGFISNVQNPQIPNVQFSHAGTYSLTITVNGQTSDPTTTEVSVYNPPVGTLSGGASICKGDSTQLVVTATGPAPYRASINAGSGPMIVDFMNSPHSFWVKPLNTTTYSLVGISNLACTGSFSGEAIVTVRPTPIPDFTASNLCSGKQTVFNDETVLDSGSIASWAWDFGNGNTSNVQNPVHVYNAGNYNVTLSVVSNTGCSAVHSESITVAPTPQANAGNDKSIPFGTTTQLNGSASGGSGSHSYLWTPSDKVVNAAILTPMTTQLESTTDFILTATDNGNGCQQSDQMTVTVTGGPLNAQIQASPPEICIGGSTLLNAMISGGSGNYTYSWTSLPAGFTSSLEDVTVNPVVTTTYKLNIYDGFNSFNQEILIVVNPLPVFNITPVAPIPHGTSTTLVSNIVSGAQPFLYHWQPESKVINPNASQTLTTNLYQSQGFTLTVTDNKGCVSGSQTEVTITGTELEVNPIADEVVICRNDSTTLRAVPGGGSNSYVSFTWSGTDGFYSTEATPKVSPAISTDYTVTVNDGFNTVSGNVRVNVNQLPQIDLIPHNDPRVQLLGNGNIGICVYDTVTLDAGNPGFDYNWSNGSSNQTIIISTSGLSFDEQHYEVIVTNPETGCLNTSEISAFFTFQSCSYGIDEQQIDPRLTVYPNPSSDGQFNVIITEFKGNMQIDIHSLIGKLLFSQPVELNSGLRSEILINLADFAKGIYILKLSGNNEIISRPLIISR
ncbi:MAG: T9SS type A sorting domain-containing protein [Lentimicrobium sp.]|nr:T9SS type A sorting domain-containing protein [Lentimicrobium sp.]